MVPMGYVDLGCKSDQTRFPSTRVDGLEWGSNARPLDYAFQGRRSTRCGTEMVVYSKCHCDEKSTTSHKSRLALTNRK
jgi:hypothetical protein